MGLFGPDKYCLHCNEKVGINKHETKEGYLCTTCSIDLCGYTYTADLKSKTTSMIYEDMALYKSSKDLLENFKPTKKVGNYIEFDEERELIVVEEVLFGKKKRQCVFEFKDVVEVELLEDGDTITKGGLGSAAIGGLLFGGVGAIVGGVTGGKKTKAIVNKLQIKITFNNFNSPVRVIDLLSVPTKSNSLIYNAAYEAANQIMSTFAIIEQRKETANSMASIQVAQVSDADEIMKYKSLLDSGIITQEEFDFKKKQLLGL